MRCVVSAHYSGFLVLLFAVCVSPAFWFCPVVHLFQPKVKSKEFTRFLCCFNFSTCKKKTAKRQLYFAMQIDDFIYSAHTWIIKYVSCDEISMKRYAKSGQNNSYIRQYIDLFKREISVLSFPFQINRQKIHKLAKIIIRSWCLCDEVVSILLYLLDNVCIYMWI